MAKAYLYSLTDTWDSAGTTFNAIKMNVTDTASAADSNLLELQTSGSSRFSLRKSGVGLAHSEWQAPSIWATSVIYVGPSAQVGLISNGVGTLEQRGGTNAQTFRVYNTYTDASNYERGFMQWTANFFEVGTVGAGTGNSARSVRLKTTGAGNVILTTNGGDRWYVNSSGHFLAAADNTYDIGASGATRPRNVYVAGLADIRGSLYVGGSVEFIGVSAGVVTLREFATSAFNRLQFGGSTSSFPSLKRSGAEMHVRLADDSAFAKLISAELSSTASLKAHVNTAIPAGGTAGAGVVVSSTSNFGVFFGSGAPTLSAAKGSLYLRSDGTTTNDRMYVNTDGATAWTAVITAA